MNWMLAFTALHIFNWSLASEGFGGEFHVNWNTLCANLHFKRVFLHENKGNTSKHGTSSLLSCACPPCLGGRGLLVGIPRRCDFVFKSSLEEPHQAMSIIHLSCHHYNTNPPPTREAAGLGLWVKNPEVWMVWTWMEGKPQQRDERKDDRWWARMWRKERSGGRVEDVEAEGWQVIVAQGVTEMVGRRKDEQALIFCTRRFLYTWREGFDSKLSCSPLSFAIDFILCLPWADVDKNGKLNLICHKLKEKLTENDKQISRGSANFQIRWKNFNQTWAEN